MAELDKVRQKHLAFAEWMDSWRIFPRVLVAIYGGLVAYMVMWFIGIPTHLTTECDPAILTLLIEKGIELAQAKEVACTITGVVGGPTTQHTVLVTAICSLATGIFGFYTNSGRKWNGFTFWNGKDKPEATTDTEDA